MVPETLLAIAQRTIMAETFSHWHAAKEYAQNSANRYRMSMGIESVRGFNGRAQYRVFMLPSVNKRFGFELRCEVVDPQIELNKIQDA